MGINHDPILAHELKPPIPPSFVLFRECATDYAGLQHGLRVIPKTRTPSLEPWALRCRWRKLTLRTASLTNMLDWLTQPQGPHLVDGSSTENPLTALAILIAPEALYDSDSPMVGLGLVYKAPYIQTTSWTEAYFNLKLASQAEVGNRPTRTKVIFVQIQASSQVIPLPGVPTLS